MSFTMQSLTALTLMPNPDVENSEEVEADVNIRQSMDNTFYTYSRQSNQRRVNYTWSNLGRGKIAEIQEFFKLSYGERLTIKDHRDVQYTVIVEDNTLEFTTTKRTFNSGGPRNEAGTTTLTFVGERI